MEFLYQNCFWDPESLFTMPVMSAEQYMMAQMAPLIKDCLTLENVVLPKSFCDIIK